MFAIYDYSLLQGISAFCLFHIYSRHAMFQVGSKKVNKGNTVVKDALLRDVVIQDDVVEDRITKIA